MLRKRIALTFCQLMSVFSVKVNGKVSLSIQCYKHTDKTTTADQSIQYYRQAEGLLSLHGNSG